MTVLEAAKYFGDYRDLLQELQDLELSENSTDTTTANRFFKKIDSFNFFNVTYQNGNSNRPSSDGAAGSSRQ